MTRGHLTDHELEEIQERSRRAWNNLVARDEAEERARQAEEPAERPKLRLVGEND